MMALWLAEYEKSTFYVLECKLADKQTATRSEKLVVL